MIDIPQAGAAAIAPSDLDPDGYLDGDRRYRLMTPSDSQTSFGATPLVVIDCQPEAGSPLQDLQVDWLETPTLNPAEHPLAVTVPPEAYPYLALQTDYFPSVPELHHAWQTPHRTLLLIEDRSIWLSLAAGWAAIDDPLQRLQWLFETTLLWEALAPWHGQATLLTPQRLALNENNLLCLTQVDQMPNRPALPLAALGQMWQSMLDSGSCCLPPKVQALISDLAEGLTNDLDRVQTTLGEAAQAYSPPVEVFSTSRPEPDEAITASNLEPDIELPTAGFDLDVDAVFDTQELPDDDDGSGLIETPTMVLPMKLAHLDDAGQSHIGQQRHHNEDWFFTQTQLQKVSGPQGSILRSKGLYILCDGMGGHASGEVASQLAVRTLRDYLTQHWSSDRLPDQSTLAQAVLTANQTIFDINQTNATSGVGRMGTTLVMVLLHNLDIAVVHVGDSRLYSYNKRLGLRQLTLDHEVGQREINRGVEPALAYARPDAYQLTQALGPRGKEDLVPGIAYHELTEDTLLILCSDGLSDNDLLERHADTHIASLLRSRANLDSGAAQLIDLANEKNGHDNITTILVRVKLQPDMLSMAS
ncbi:MULTISPECIES: serine/threonine phosphatase [Cyanophyceae]|uniref:serine/threonine phosphatase n=1 Tax=Cyanophyceae TaxID=3028117 RepID=UPI0016873ED2|nr:MULTISPECIES: serine/threonine phosphatase [unclassified Phormidium]MBD1914467.1 serine/threonine phosphatase [Phormidium sp. FACHB-77]MBD2031040.1 serine/threonine phosphatase [Phormidium sp. FACHB-322]MBD2052127.1 serine/threonine phosphatase [Leptolyngbya sp. FACHB-60]